MARYEMIDGKPVLVNRTKIPGRDNVADLPAKKSDKPAKLKKKAKAESTKED